MPNPNNAEFIYYIGLKRVVDYLTGSNQQFSPPEPFGCVQCGTDLTPVWKWKDSSDPSKPSVICESCVFRNIKKTAVKEHTKRINTFSKTYKKLEKQVAATAAAVAAASLAARFSTPLTKAGAAAASISQAALSTSVGNDQRDH